MQILKICLAAFYFQKCFTCEGPFWNFIIVAYTIYGIKNIANFYNMFFEKFFNFYYMKCK